AVPSVKGEPTSTAPFGSETRRALEVFFEHAEMLGFSTHHLDGYCGYVEWGPAGAPIIAAVCHLDVVPAGTWQQAFEPIRLDEKLYGRGSCDDKGPAVIVLYALKALRDKGYTPQHRFRIILGLDEESGSACMDYYRKKAELPVAAFTPDADFPVIAAEKGLLHLKLSIPIQETHDAAGRPARITLKAGTRANVVPDEAVVDVEVAGTVEQLRYAGKSAHASKPETGENAVDKGMQALAEAGYDNQVIQFYDALLARDHNGEKLGIACSDERSGKLTVNVGLARISPEKGEFLLDVRYPVTADSSFIIETVQKAVSPWNGSCESPVHSAPLNLPDDHPLVATLMETYNEVMGTKAKPIGIGGGTYARSLPNTVAFGPVFPGEVVNLHEPDEAVNLNSLLKSGVIYAKAFLRLDAVYADSET
ncbi:MAG TPA: M20 family metallopeptidase, partial [Clostridiaceae bacterium]|nr:M20 family metallopeptidase [Clostridiaceae bacterium]